MLRRLRQRRSGFSLVEVLVAMFIVAAGLIALMSLFPVGAVQMGKALQADRAQNTCLQADARIRELWRTQVTESLAPADPFYTALTYADDLDGPGPGPSPTGTPPIPETGTNAHRTSYPVLFDPVGYDSYASQLLKRLSVAAAGQFPRRTSLSPLLTFPNTRLGAIRTCVMPDDIEFATADGVAGTPADGEGNPMNGANQLFRHGRYNWAAVLQRPDNGMRGVADLKILVFDRRAVGVNPSDNELVYPNATNPTLIPLTVGQTEITFSVANDTLGLRTGTWIMDGTLSNTPGAGIRNAKFYKVTSYVEGTNPVAPFNPITTATIHVPISKPTGEAAAATPYNATLYILRELIEVYDRPQLTPAGYQKQTP
jgi:prepilin-type N-terminal cleavage/methylation domain-containing protein